MKELLVYGAISLLTLAGVEVFRRWSLQKEFLDVPNERSSHTIPTPRGGGLIIVIVCLTVYVITTLYLTGGFQWSYLLGACTVALISWVDDLYTISSIWRFAVHSGAALLVIFTLGSFEQIDLPIFGSFDFGVLGGLLTFFWIVWLTNAYNFMDGIDGIAGLQALTAGIGWYLCGIILNAPITGFYGGIIASASLGFLVLNWHPAKIFMGDVGSAFLGYSFAALPLLAKSENGFNKENGKFLLLVAAFIVWLFVFDTLWTFVQRLLNGEKVWQAHRSHIYQRLVISGFSHSFVSGLYGVVSALNLVVLILHIKNVLPIGFVLILISLQAIGLLGGLYFIRRRMTG